MRDIGITDPKTLKLAKEEERRLSCIEREARTVERAGDIFAIHCAEALGKWLQGLIKPMTERDRANLERAQARRDRRKAKRC